MKNKWDKKFNRDYIPHIFINKRNYNIIYKLFSCDNFYISKNEERIIDCYLGDVLYKII